MCVNEEYNAECVNWFCECARICQVCKTIMYCNDVGISGAVGVLVVCVSVCWGMSGGVSVLWCGLVACVRRRLIMRACITSSGGCVLNVQV